MKQYRFQTEHPTEHNHSESRSFENYYHSNAHLLGQITNPQYQRLHTLIQSTNHLEYDQVILETQHAFYLNKFQEKELIIKKQKDKIYKQNHQINHLNSHLQMLDQKHQKLMQGQKQLCLQKQKYLQKQEEQRQERLNVMSQKTQLYHKFVIMQQEYERIIEQIQNYEPIELEYEVLKKEKQRLMQVVEEMKMKQRKSPEEQEGQRKQRLKLQIKKEAERISMLQAEDDQINTQYEECKSKINHLQKEENAIQQRSQTIHGLYTTVQKIKQEIMKGRENKQDLEEYYRQVCSQEDIVTREIQADIECKQAQKQYKDSLVQRFKIIDSEADEEANKKQANPKEIEAQLFGNNPNIEALINRFQRIKDKRNL